MTHADAPVPIWRLAGSHREIGLRHGQLSGARIRAFLDDDLARINKVVAEPMSLEGLNATLIDYADVIERHVPALYQELLGLAQGAGISLKQAVLLQIRRELTKFTRLPASGDCTAFAHGEGAHTALAQTVDLNGGMRDALSVLRIDCGSGRKRHQSILLSFTGLLGYLGMNDRGLGIGLNLVLGGEWGVGIPGYMAIRHLLDSAGSVDEALDILATLPLASSRSLMVCDRKKKVVVEYIRDEQHLITGPVLVHANHFLHEAFVARDALNPLAAVFSRQRQQACEARLAALGQEPSPADYLAILAEPPIQVAGSSDVRREETVATVVMQPGLGMLWLRKGGSDAVQVLQDVWHDYPAQAASGPARKPLRSFN